MSVNGTAALAQRYEKREFSYITESMSKTILFDSVDSCIKKKKCAAETKESKVEEKSFIQQRVERLYGPGALAQGFFVLKKSKETTTTTTTRAIEATRNGVNAASGKEENGDVEVVIRQSSSTPTLPVLRHLRPEFRAQLPFIVPKRTAAEEASMQKSITAPTLSEKNGERVEMNCGFEESKKKKKEKGAQNGTHDVCDRVETRRNSNVADVKDGHYFLKILDNETHRLLKLAEEAETELKNPDLPEEGKGYLRSASGKARLLVTQKMQQFKGLCTNNVTQVEGEAFPTTNEDLQGFWDMILLQVDQVNNIFKELETLRANNWQEVKPAGDANRTRKVAVKPQQPRPVNATTEENRRLREQQRKKLLEERRRAMREEQKKSKSAQQIEIFVPESS